MGLEKIVAIAGKPGLYEVISRTKTGVIVESLENKKRLPVGALHKISTLNDIAIYTYAEEVPLRAVLLSIYDMQDGKAAIDGKSDKGQLMNFFREVLPEYDEDRVYASNVKKVLNWYNALVEVDFDFEALKKELEEEKEEDQS